MMRISLRRRELLAIPMLAAAVGWYLLLAERVAVFLYTGFTRDRLWEFCVENLPAGLPPVNEGPLPGANSEPVPIKYSCTYTQTDPSVTVTYLDLAGTAIAVLPLVVLLALVAVRIASGQRRTAKES